MADADGSGEIIIKGGSCEIHFDDGVFDKETTSDKKQKHKHKKDVKINRIVITGTKSWDSGDITGFKGDITIRYKG